jgi:hypothetical protein
MSRKALRVVRLFVLVGVVFSGLGVAPSSRPVSRGSEGGASVGAGDGVATLPYPEVRLRKLHLVRPDLIPYPLAYEILC